MNYLNASMDETIMPTHLELYTPINKIFNDNYFDSFDKMFTFLDDRARSHNIKLELTLEDFIEFKKNPSQHTVMTEMYFTFKHTFKELIEIYNLNFPYVLSKKYQFTINQISNELLLTQQQQKTIVEAVTNYAGDTWLEEAIPRLYERAQKDRAFNQNFKKEFEEDLALLMKKYKKRYPTIPSGPFLDLLELRIVEGPLKEILHSYTNSSREEVIKSSIEALSSFQKKRGRPKSKRYDELLSILKTALTDQATSAYMSKLIHTLKKFASSDETLFKGFEINENSLRAKLSKSKN